jgi:ankyrin repeat protein
MLLQKGADANVADYFGRRPLDVAEKYNRTEVASLLREHGV